jgi:pyruvate/2-oxoglutarate dehydrogenase complex dihydrolipoamide dehydrogenase (E3) component
MRTDKEILQMVDKYDAIIIGSGQGGGPLATTLAKAGWKVALIEREYVGGTCVNRGCTPTKTMVASARVAYLTRRAADYGVQTGPIAIDMKKVRQRKRDIVENFRISGQQYMESVKNLDLIFGEASFSDPETVQVLLNSGEKRRVGSAKIFINTGGRPVVPPVEGLEKVPTLDSTSIMELDTVPEHLIMIGGGYIGLEFGQMFHRFGSRVTVLQRGSQLLPREDADVTEELTRILKEDGLDIILEADLKRAERKGEHNIQLSFQTPDGERNIIGSHVLLSAGRIPNTEALNLGAAGIETDDRGFVKVSEHLETNVAGVYAMGDVKGGPAFTHIAYDDFRILSNNLLQGESAGFKDRLVPYTLFTDPQLGRIGMGEKEALRKGHNIRIAKLPMSQVARAIELDETRGFMKAIVDSNTDQILGAVVLGIEGGEVMSVFEMAMIGKVAYPTIRDTIFAHPTLAESLNNLFMAIGDEIKSDASMVQSCIKHQSA